MNLARPPGPCTAWTARRPAKRVKLPGSHEPRFTSILPGGTVMNLLLRDRGLRISLIVDFACAGVAATLPTLARAAMPVLSPQVQAYVAHAEPLLAITHVRVIDGHGTKAKRNQTVLLRDGRIAAVGPHVNLPAGATVVDGTGQTLIPGLVGMHDHMFYPAPKVNPAAKEAIYPEQASSFPKLYL